jgi:hypothetical protein
MLALCVTVPAPADPLGLVVRVEENPAEDSWNVRYEFSAPVRGIVFSRGLQPPREARWSVRSKGETPRWTRIGQGEAILLGQADSRAVVVGFPSDPALRQDYLFTVAYTDGSRLLYTGHLAVEPLTCPKPKACSADELERGKADARWEFRTAANRGVRVLDRAGRGGLTWKPPPALVPENGTYVYFGDIEPRATERLTAVVDPGLPEWTIELAAGFLPRLFDYYAEDLGVELDFNPLVLMSFMQPETPGLTPTGTTSKGGTLDGLIQFALGGDGWAGADPGTTHSLRKSLAHEAFHLWNGQMFHRRLGRSDRWLSEGSADYFAYVALRDLGFTDGETFERVIVRDANRCIVAIRGSPLARSGGEDDAFYPCGAVIQFLADRAVEEGTGGEQDVASLFGAMFRAALAGDRSYARFDWLEEFQVLAGDLTATAAIERLLHAGVRTDADEFFRERLAAAGLAVELVPVEDAPGDHVIHGAEPHPSYSRLLALARE